MVRTGPDAPPAGEDGTAAPFTAVDDDAVLLFGADGEVRLAAVAATAAVAAAGCADFSAEVAALVVGAVSVVSRLAISEGLSQAVHKGRSEGGKISMPPGASYGQRPLSLPLAWASVQRSFCKSASFHTGKTNGKVATSGVSTTSGGRVLDFGRGVLSGGEEGGVGVREIISENHSYDAKRHGIIKKQRAIRV